MVDFEPFAFNSSSGELSGEGRPIKLHPQPAQVLALLIRRAGELVTREEIKEELWADDTFVDFDLGINSCIRQIRTALGDDAEKPLYIQTIPRKGYRFLAALDREARGHSKAPARLRLTALLALVLALIVWLSVDRLREWQRTAAPRRPIHSLAVLPLTNLSANPEQDYFADGMTEALIGALGKISALRVISRTSVMRYKNSDRRLPEIARELNVDAIVEGSVLRSDNQVRITATLVESVTDARLWGASYERDIRDVISLQREVARRIAREIRIAVTPDEEVRLASASSVDPQALEAYFRGRSHLNESTPRDVRQSVEFFKKAIARDPDFALPHAYLARSFALLGGLVDYVFPPREAMERAKASALRAIEIDPLLAEGHASLGFVQSAFERDWPGAERAFERSLELNPSFSNVHGWYAVHLSRMGRHEESVEEMTRAKALDPLSTRDFIRGFVRYLAADYDQAITLCRMTLAIEPRFPPAHRVLGFTYMAKRMYAEAIDEHSQAVELTRRNSIAD